MLNEEIANDVKEQVVKPILRFVIRQLKKISEKDLVEGMKKVRDSFQKKKENKHGEMSIKDLIKKDQGAQVVDIDGMGLRDFRRLANKFGVDFAIVKSTGNDKPKYSVFFKARDADAISAVINEYTARQLKIEKFGRPSILAKLEAFKKIAADLSKKAVEKMKEAVR